jgi:cysteine synthase A
MLVMSEIQSVERRRILQALGAEVILTPAEEGTRGAREKLKQICDENPSYFYIGQHVNMSNPKAHFETTGPEIWASTEGEIDVFVGGLGTGGTISGSGRYLKSMKPTVELIGVEPAESPFISTGEFHPHRMMGTAPGFLPETLDRELIDKIALVSEADAFSTCRDIAKLEGLLVGISSGAVAKVMLDLLKKKEYLDKLMVGVFADTGERYLSVEGLY